LFGAASATLLAQRWDQVCEVERELRRVADLCRSLRITACHCDLHPHNILMAGASVAAFIDFESFTAMPVAAALGFAAYKLVRQHAVAQSFTRADRECVRKAAMRFVAGLRSSMEGIVDADTLRLMALAEIFRRLLVVFRLNLRGGDARWNHVLPMHLSGFEEIELMFGAA
jgi:Ser/Thr protein kinase RdoA (MazF antagonist)